MNKGFKNAVSLLLSLFFSTYLITVNSAESDTEESPAHPVSMTLLEEILFYPSREAPATVISLNNSLISAEISGEIIELLVQIGDEVRKNDVLAKIDCEPYAIAKQRANSALNAGYARNKYAKQRFKDAEKLRKSKTISSDQLNLRSSEASALASDVGVLNADLKETIRRVSKCVITAPFDAVVIDRLASVGDYTTTGTPLVKLLDINNLEVSGKIQQQDVDSLETAEKVNFIVSGKDYPVELRTIVPLVDSRIRSFEARLQFTEQVSPSGSAGRLRWMSLHAHIPADYLVQRNEQLGVFIVDNGSAHFYLLENIGNGLPAPIDLPPDTQIITTGRYGLVDGQLINVIPTNN